MREYGSEAIESIEINTFLLELKNGVNIMIGGDSLPSLKGRK